MNRKLIIILLIFTLYALNARGQSTADFERRLYDSYVNGEIWEWKDIILDMTNKYEQDKNTELLYSLSFAQYGYIGYLLSKDLKNEAQELLNDALRNARELDDLLDGRHDVSALRGALLGYRIAIGNFSSIYLGPKASYLINSSQASSDKYFNCSLEMGNMLFYTPKILGGSKKEALAYYGKAVDIIEGSALKEDRNWIYMNTVLLLANAYYENGFEELACDLYAGLLEYESRATWIKQDLSIKCKK